jgi:hypothetical protein
MDHPPEEEEGGESERELSRETPTAPAESLRTTATTFRTTEPATDSPTDPIRRTIAAQKPTGHGLSPTHPAHRAHAPPLPSPLFALSRTDIQPLKHHEPPKPQAFARRQRESPLTGL